MLVICDKPGQLGNRLFVFASVMAFALGGNQTVLNPAFHDYALFFEATMNNPLCRFPPRNGRFLGEAGLLEALAYWLILRVASVLHRVRRESRWWVVKRLRWMETCRLDAPEFRDLAQRQLVFLQGWLFRDVEGLVRFRGEIRKFFRLRRDWESEVDASIRNLRLDADVLIGVHIRQGDYNERLERKWFYSVDQYVSVMRELRGLFPASKVRFLVCSNVSQTAEDFENLDCRFGPGHPAKDMYALASCDYLAGPPSSFNLWASFVGEVPLYLITDPVAVPALSDFRISPEVVDSTVHRLYFGD